MSTSKSVLIEKTAKFFLDDVKSHCPIIPTCTRGIQGSLELTLNAETGLEEYPVQIQTGSFRTVIKRVSIKEITFLLLIWGM